MNKKVILLSLALSLVFSAMAQKMPKGAKYWIKGNYTLTVEKGKWVGKLYDLQSKNIEFANTDTLRGTAIEDNYQRFVFRDVKCEQDLSDKGPGLKFYKMTSSGWEPDSEVKNAKLDNVATSDMVVVLTLDCSNSLGNNFNRVKQSAINFINILEKACPEGNVKLGLIAFNSMNYADKNTVAIQPLTATSKEKLNDFITNLQMGSNTALYYSIDKASQMLDKYVSKNYKAGSDLYEGAIIVSFTDGYDNASLDANLGTKGVDFENPYFKHVNGLVHEKTIGGKKLESYLIAINSDDTDSKENGKFARLLKGVSSKDENFMMAKDFNEVDQKFREMGESLVRRWENLVCIVPPAHDGQVCWVLGSAATPAPATKSKSTHSHSDDPHFVGVNAGFGLSFNTDLDHYVVYIGGEAAVRINDKVMGGVYFSTNTLLDLSFGPLAIVNLGGHDFMFGAGLTYRPGLEYTGYTKSWEPLNLRAGMVWDKVYVFLSGGLGYSNNKNRSAVALHVGYRF
ncbi:MAG: VWA domain-containing protein [Bacteroidales bacterium]|nr:VWA domain-containing protein [Bacteroidales bacterium]